MPLTIKVSPANILRRYISKPRVLSRVPKEQTARVLKLLLAQPGDFTHGYALAKAARLSHASVYTIISRLVDDELVEQEWNFEGKRPRNLFRLNKRGLSVAQEALKMYHEAELEKLSKIKNNPVNPISTQHPTQNLPASVSRYQD